MCANLRKNGATEEEAKFLLTHRVELNAFTSDALVRWIIAKLKQHGVEKVIPDEAVLAEAYRRRHQSRYITTHFDELIDDSRQHVENLDIPADLQEQVARLLQERPALSWNDAVAEMTQNSAEMGWTRRLGLTDATRAAIASWRASTDRNGEKGSGDDRDDACAACGS